jgi:hypothetical protein
VAPDLDPVERSPKRLWPRDSLFIMDDILERHLFSMRDCSVGQFGVTIDFQGLIQGIDSED